MALYLQSQQKPELAFEVLDYDGAAHTAVLRNATGTYTDPHFRLAEVKQYYTLTDVMPTCLKGEEV